MKANENSKKKTYHSKEKKNKERTYNNLMLHENKMHSLDLDKYLRS